jgi:hypothetical protein
MLTVIHIFTSNFLLVVFLAGTAAFAGQAEYDACYNANKYIDGGLAACEAHVIRLRFTRLSLDPTRLDSK